MCVWEGRQTPGTLIKCLSHLTTHTMPLHFQFVFWVRLLTHHLSVKVTGPAHIYNSGHCGKVNHLGANRIILWVRCLRGLFFVFKQLNKLPDTAKTKKKKLCLNTANSVGYCSHCKQNSKKQKLKFCASTKRYLFPLSITKTLISVKKISPSFYCNVKNNNILIVYWVLYRSRSRFIYLSHNKLYRV